MSRPLSFPTVLEERRRQENFGIGIDVRFWTSSDIREEVARLDPDFATDEGGWYARFAGLPEKLVPGSLYATGEVHTHSSHEEEAFWLLHIDLAPDSPPPESLVEASARSGGYARLFETLSQIAPSVEGIVDVRFLVPVEVGLGDIAPPSDLAGGGITAQASEIKWTVTGAPLAAQIDVQSANRDGDLAVTVSGDFVDMGALTSGLLEELENQAWLDLQAICRQTGASRIV